MIVFLTDGYADRPASSNPRVELQFEIARLKARLWADPGDSDLIDRIEQLKAELRALDHTGNGSGS